MSQLAQLESIYFAALERSTPADRSAYLDSACSNNPDLRRRVEKMIAAEREAGSFLESPPSTELIDGRDLAEAYRVISEGPDSLIGPYRLVKSIGEGGFGVVYMAEQLEPVRRKVALKIIKPGMDTQEVIARFESERQALALMDHPNIAKVLDAGATGSGRPYFVMELVPGTPFTEYCDENGLAIDQRLMLLVDVCHAVGHAHQKGIIHRDIKPSNVMMAMHDGRPVPKVIDFGVAKATGQQLTERMQSTAFGQIIGTPLYMSPEQAEMRGDIDTRSDIYSLGVLLYELLTGTTPFDQERLKSASFDEMRRIIREEEPETVSKRLAKTRSSHHAPRDVPKGLLSRSERATELDWIVCKALEKDRERRYDTANSFALDLQRYLADEPVLACPPSAIYRLRKFAQRNRARLTGGAALGLALLMAVGAIGWAIRDRGARQEQARRERIERQERATGQIRLILDEVGQLERDQKWPEALDAAQRAFDLVKGSDADAKIAADARAAVEELELVRLLEEIRASAIEPVKGQRLASEETAERYAAAFQIAGIDLNHLTPEEAAEKARSHAAVIAAIIPALDEWGIAYRFAGKEEMAQSVWNVAALVDTDKGQQRIRQARAARDTKAMQALAEDPDLANQPVAIITRLVIYLQEMGQTDAAAEVLTKAQRRHPSDFWVHFQLAHTLASKSPPELEQAVGCYRAALAVRPRSNAAWNNLGNALKDLNRADEAVACYQRAIELEPKNFMARSNLGVQWLAQGKVEDAIASFQTAIEINPKGAFLHSHMGQALAKKGLVDDAIGCYRKAIELNPKLAVMHHDLGILQHRQNKLDDAVASFTKATELNPQFPGAYRNLGALLFKQQRIDEAVAVFKQAIEVNPSDAVAHYNMGIAQQRLSKPSEAVGHFQRAVELDRNYTGAHLSLADTLLRLKQYDEAIACYRKTIELDPKLATAHENLGAILCDQKKDYPGAIECFRKAIALQPQRAIAHLNLGVALVHLGLESEALAAYREAVRLQPTYARALASMARLLTTSADLHLRNAQEALQLARKAVELTPQSAESRQVLGWAHYRAGDWKASIEELKQASALQVNPPGGNHWQWLFLAMAHWQTGDKAEARRWYDQAVTSMEKLAAKDEELLRIRAEAEQLLDLTPK